MSGIGIPAARGGSQHHLAHRRSGVAHGEVAGLHGSLSPGALAAHQRVAVGRAYRCGHHANLAALGIEFVGYQGGQPGVDALAHLHVFADHGYRVVGIQLDERQGIRRSRKHDGRAGCLAAGGFTHDGAPALELAEGGDDADNSAVARWMAWRIRA